MEQKPRLAIDVDGVICDMVSQIIPVLRQEYDFVISRENWKRYNFVVNGTTVGRIIVKNQMNPDFVMAGPIIHGAPQAIRALRAFYHVSIVTARPLEALEPTKEWLKENGITYDDFLPCFNRKELPCDILIDDSMRNIVDYLDTTYGRALVFWQTYNFDDFCCEDIERRGPGIRRLALCGDWIDVLDELV